MEPVLLEGRSPLSETKMGFKPTGRYVKECFYDLKEKEKTFEEWKEDFFSSLLWKAEPDCDDEDPYINPKTIWYQLSWHGQVWTKRQCTRPEGYNSFFEVGRQLVFRDKDCDGWGDPKSPLQKGYETYEYVSNDGDCDDSDPRLGGGTIWARDKDGDGFVDPNQTKQQCTNPGGDYMIYEVKRPEGSHIQFPPPPPEPERRMYDKEGEVSRAPVEPFDCFDMSGIQALEDCNDNDPSINFKSIWYKDADGDGLGNPAISVEECTPPEGYVGNKKDTDDNNAFADVNYIYTAEPLAPLTSIEKNTAKVSHIEYFDGLGRPMEQIAVGANPQGKDIVTPVVYDEFGRQTKEYLPYPTEQSNGYFVEVSTAQRGVSEYYRQNYKETTGYSEKELEASPLNRVLKQAAPGEAWKLGSGHEVQFDYATNAAGEVKRFDAMLYGWYVPRLQPKGDYPAGQLYKTVTKDENYTGSGPLHTTEEFKDKEGQVVLKRTYVTQQGAAQKLDTYFVYDDYGNLTYVLPPKFSKRFIDKGFAESDLLVDQEILAGEFVSFYNSDGTYYPIEEPDLLGIIIYSYKGKIKIDMLQFLYVGYTYHIDTSKKFKIKHTDKIRIPDQFLGNLWDIYMYYDRYSIYIENEEIKIVDNHPEDKTHGWGFGLGFNAEIKYYVKEGKEDELGISDNEFNQLAYQYQYDDRNRLVEKQLPGKGREYFVYDKQDRLVATQDSVQRSNRRWLFTKYDRLGRVLYTGMTTAGDREAVQRAVDAKGNNDEEKTDTPTSIEGIALPYTTTRAWPSTIDKLLTVNEYDRYPADAPPAPKTILGQPIVTASTDISTQGLATAVYTRVLSSSRTQDWEKTYTYYDPKGRVIRSEIQNHLGGYTRVDSELDFRGKPLKTETRHKRAVCDAERLTTDYFTYDHAERLVKHTQQTEGSEALQRIAENEYDKLGCLQQKKVGGAEYKDPLQNLRYSYNIRGWLTGINSPFEGGTGGVAPLFGMQLHYNHPLQEGTPALYNGNISELSWQTATDHTERGYSYRYDALSRLNEAYFIQDGQAAEYYNVTGITYDENGNIKTLQRKGSSAVSTVLIDDLHYTYNKGNRLQRVADASKNPEGFNSPFEGGTGGVAYTYDANGSLTADKNKGITQITYNFLHLPQEITFANGNKIEYTYNAAGVKLGKKVTVNGKTTTTDYLSGYQYKNGQLQFYTMAEGYVKIEEGKPVYVYNYTDHLGNVRLSYTDKNGTLQLLQEKNYYPFGLTHKGYNETVAGTLNRYKNYQGQELNTE